MLRQLDPQCQAWLLAGAVLHLWVSLRTFQLMYALRHVVSNICSTSAGSPTGTIQTNRSRFCQFKP